MSDATFKKTDHTLSYGKLVLVLVCLLLLTAITVAVSRFDLGSLNIWAAVLIAAMKASLVLVFFMELKEEGRPIVRTFIITVVLLAIAIGFIFWDVAFR